MYIGVDLGGTNIAAGVVSEEGRIISQASVPTKSGRHYSEIIKDMADLCKKVAKDANISLEDIKAVGVGSPGTIDNEKGMVVYSNNLKMDHTPLAEELGAYLNLPVNVENDANAAAYGEYIVNGEGIKNFIFITLGTGVGGGIIIDGKIYRGFNGAAGELGHSILIHNGEPCSCGGHGCWERYASVTALISQTKKAMGENPESLMNELSKKEGGVNGKIAFDAAKQGDEAAKAVVAQYTEYIASGILSMINIFQPKKIVIGGGISKEGDYLLNPINDYIDEKGYNKYLERTTITISTLFNDAGIIGAALAARK